MNLIPVVVSYLSFPTCRFLLAVSHLPFPIAVSHLPFPILGFRPLFSGNSCFLFPWLEWMAPRGMRRGRTSSPLEWPSGPFLDLPQRRTEQFKMDHKKDPGNEWKIRLASENSFSQKEHENF